MTPVLVALLGLVFLGERPGPWQWLGVAIAVFGAGIYFYPVVFPADQVLGLVIVGLGMLFNAFSALVGRRINRQANLSPRLVTTVSMGVGAAILLSVGIPLQGIPRLTATGWFIVVWLAVVNTAMAFTLWNLTLRTLTAVESSVINNTMSIQIPILAVLFLGERPDLKGWIGLALTAFGTLAVQMCRRGAGTGPLPIPPSDGEHGDFDRPR
jgi:drug/metabolite transporter (DMT)-like permease